MAELTKTAEIREIRKNYLQSAIFFLKRQVTQIAEGGLYVLLQKTCDIFLMPFAILILFIVRLLRPFLVIRFGALYSARIGHFAINTELYLCERGTGIHYERTLDIFYHLKPICNYQLKKMWDRILHVSKSTRLTYLIDRLNRRLAGFEKHVIPMPLKNCRDINGFLKDSPIHLYFTAEEEDKGRQALQGLGIPGNSHFVCFHARDSAYLETVYPSYNWRNHDYRNSSIRNYVPAAEELARRGYYMIRMGAIVKEPLNTTNPMIIDYATKHRTDFLDIYLSAKCRFFIASGSGIDEVPTIFRRPVVYVNFIRFEYIHSWYPVYLTIPKKLWLRSEKRFLTFREIMESGIGRFGKEEYEQYEQLGIEIVENTPEEIIAVAKETDERLKGAWQTTEEDEGLQRRFWSLFEQSEVHGKIASRIGAEFLRQNRELLD